jgi:hypothetical protein
MRTTPLTSALAGRGKAAAAVAAAAAVLAGAGTASAAALTSTPAPHQAPALAAGHTAPALAAGRTGATALAARPGTGLLATPDTATLNPAAQHPAPAQHADPVRVTHGSNPAPAPATAKPAPAPAPARPGPAAAPAPAPAPAPATPYQVYDSVTPTQIPGGARVATYADGGYAASPAAVAGRSHVTWIDTNASDPRAAALDVEPGDATPVQAATWTWQKLHSAAGDLAIIYTMRSDWPATQAAIATLPAAMQHQVRWWIADPTGVPHIVPGASATQWYWGQNYDISTAAPGSGL